MALPEGFPIEVIEHLERTRTLSALRRTELRPLHEEAVRRNSEELERVAGWDLFREAVVW